MRPGRTASIALLVLLVTLGVVRPARADLTAFVGNNASPSNRQVRGVAVGFSLLVVGFEFELSDTRADAAADAPGLKTGMANMLVQTPFGIAGLQFYATAGAGLYQEEGGGIGHHHRVGLLHNHRHLQFLQQECLGRCLERHSPRRHRYPQGAGR